MKLFNSLVMLWMVFGQGYLAIAVSIFLVVKAREMGRRK